MKNTQAPTNTPGLKIVATARALPSRIVTNDDMAKIVDTDNDWIVTRTGIHSRYKCEEETCLSLATDAARTALQRSGLSSKEIGAVIVATSTATYAFPSTASQIQKELDLDEEVVCYDMYAACTGFMLGMLTVRGLLMGMRKKYALLIGAEELSRILNYEDRSSCILFGDGAGAAIFTLQDSLYVQKSWSRGSLEVLNCKGIGNDGAKLAMAGKDVFRFAVTALAQAIRDVLEEAALTMDDIDLVVCHQANERIIASVRRKFKGHEGKFYINIDRYGNTSAASIPIAFDELNEQGLLLPGKKVLCVGFGAGLTWSGAVMEL